MSKFAEAVVKRMEEEGDKPAAPDASTSAPAAETAAAEPAPEVAQTAAEEAPPPETPPAQPAPKASQPEQPPQTDSRPARGPIAALRAERAQRQAAEREIAALKAQLEDAKRAPAPAPVQQAPAQQPITEESVDDLLNRLAQTDDELSQMTAKEIRALREQIAQVKSALDDTTNWRSQVQNREQDQAFDVWLGNFKEQVPGMPEVMILRALKSGAEPTEIIAEWHEYLESNPNAAVPGRAPAATTPSRPASPPPPRIAAPSTPPASGGSLSKQDVYARMREALAG